ncbi:baseplate assembly protein [Enterococcus phage iF6]|uniref:Baseplate assembly protein n=1 Tax=Enterococcus phage iF6 TaxID=2765371 RepID=A0A7G8ZZ39_9CAUD|nr:baseplate assembly protein [Enterococcus phage iF6]
MSNFFRNIHPLLRRNKRPEKYDDTNFAVLNALNYELTQAEQETIASKIQSSLESATDTYLDTWGDWFGVYRKDGWDDEYYRARIIRELLLKRGTIPAIIDALVDFLNDNDAVVQIYEPWRNIFYTNKSKLNGDDHLMGYYYRFAIIDISIDRPFPPEIVEIIKAFKPAGVLFYLRLDTSLAKNKTTVESPYVYLDVTNKTELEFLNGLYYDLRGNINLSDQRTQVVGNNIFHTNNSKLNGEDVLAGAFNHGRGYVHLASTTLLDYTPKATDSMSNLKTTLGEAGSDMYNQTKEKDGRTASIQVPATKNVHTLYSNSLDFGEYDYSTAPNLMRTITFSDLSTMETPTGIVPKGVTDKGDYFEIDLTTMGVSESKLLWIPMTPRPQVGKQYTYSIELMCDEGEMNEVYIRPCYRNANGVVVANFNSITTAVTSTWKRYSKVSYKATNEMVNSNLQALQFYFPPAVTRRKLYVRYNIMVQEGDQTSSQVPANQMPKITTDDYMFIQSAITKTDEEGNITSFNNLPTSDGSRNIYVRNDESTKKLIPLLSDKKQYTMSVEMWSEKEVTPSIRYRVNDRNNTPKLPLDIYNKKIPAKQWTEVSVTKTLDLPSNPNLIGKLGFNDWDLMGKNITKSDEGTHISFDFSNNVTDMNVYAGFVKPLPQLVAGKKYTLTAEVSTSETWEGRIRMSYRINKTDGTGKGTLLGDIINPQANQWYTLTTYPEHHVMTDDVNDFKSAWLQMNLSNTLFKGKVNIRYTVKIEEGETYTPDYPQHWLHIAIPREYEGIIKIKNDSIKIQEGATTTTKPAWKPNLLDAPYYLSKVPLGENIADPTVKFPINVNTYKVYEGDMLESFKVGETYTVTIKGRKPAQKTFSVYNAGTVFLGHLTPVEGLSDVWTGTFTVSLINSFYPNRLQIYQLVNDNQNGEVQIDWLKIEKGNIRTPNIDSYDYVGSLIEDTETPTLDPTKYTWTVNGDVTNKKAYMVFDIKTFIEENYATEFEKLVADLGEDQALNAVFENFNISTALKALVSPSSPINFSVELYDFSTSTWHKLNTDSLDLRMRTFNLVANRITDYLNDYKLLFVRYVFDNETDKDVTVELDMLNVLFNYRLGDGYSLGLQSTVECLSEIPLKRLALSSESVEVAIGETAKVTATPVPANATNKSLEWEIADPKTATVDTSGNITGVAIGETTSTVYGEDRTISSTCSVSVKARHTLYSNSTDFGNYDYSGNPNLMRTIRASDFNVDGDGAIEDVAPNMVHVTSTGTKRLSMFTSNSIPSLTKGKTYTISAKVTIDPETTGNYDKIRICYRKTNGGTILLYAITTGIEIGKETVIKASGVVDYEITDLSRFYLSIDLEGDTRIVGGLTIKDIKIEEGLVATPYQPNLLDAPYYLGTKAVNANIADPKKVFPIKTSAYNIYRGKNTEKYQANQTYTITMKATKPATQQFGIYVNAGAMGVGNMKPVEGLIDVWQLTFKITQAHIDGGVTDVLDVYQLPNTSVGSCQIDWLKFEKGDTRTPNIDSYAYRGTVLTTSEESPKDPNAYTWSSI